MRVLDLDLDFFLADCCPLAAPGERPPLPGHEPWPAEAVADFLERQCGLSARSPVPGAVFETHDGALRFWEARLREGTLTKPFHVTHVDAHSDLGIGYPGPGYVLNGVLPQLVEARADPARYTALRQLDEANYLLFRAENITDLKALLVERGILIRSCANYRGLGPDFYRTAVRLPEENDRLLEALGEVLPWQKQL